MMGSTSRFASFAGSTLKRGRTADAVTTTLREAILDGVLAPSTWLREEELANELQVSRTPVREALRQLTAEGLTTQSPSNGTIVAPMTAQDVLAVYVVREHLEGLAARLVAEAAPASLIEELRGQLERMRELVAKTKPDASPAGLVEANIEFHRSIRQASGNPYLERFLTQVEHAVRRFGRSTFEAPGRGAEAVAEHERIVDAVAARDVKGAERYARQHMRRARELRMHMLLGR